MPVTEKSDPGRRNKRLTRGAVACAENLAPGVHARLDKIREGQLEWAAGGHGIEVDAQLAAESFDFGGVGAETGLILLAGEGGIDVDVFAGLHVSEERGLGKVEVELGGVEDAHEGDFVALPASVVTPELAAALEPQRPWGVRPTERAER